MKRDESNYITAHISELWGWCENDIQLVNDLHTVLVNRFFSSPHFISLHNNNHSHANHCWEGGCDKLGVTFIQNLFSFYYNIKKGGISNHGR